MNLLPLLPLIAVALVGAVAGIVIALGRGVETRGPDRRSTEPGLLRLQAQVHTGWEQTLLGLHRELRLPRRGDDLPYGALYLDPESEHRLLLRSRSEIGRGFLGAADIRPGRRSTEVRYSILRLPGDDQVRDRVLDLELRIIAALRRIDSNAEVQLTGTAFRELETARNPPPAGQDDAP